MALKGGLEIPPSLS